MVEKQYVSWNKKDDRIIYTLSKRKQELEKEVKSKKIVDKKANDK